MNRGTGYGDREYREMRAALAVSNVACWRCRMRRATSPDHCPPLSQHEHVRGSGCCVLRPACLSCQQDQAGRLGRPVPATASRRW